MHPFLGKNYEENERKLQINKKKTENLSPMGITQKMLERTKS